MSLCLRVYFCSGVEQFIGRFPEHVNMIKMDDGHTALHIAAANDHLDIVSLLSSMVGIVKHHDQFATRTLHG